MSRDQGTVHRCQHGCYKQFKVPMVREEIWKKVLEKTKNFITCRRGVTTDTLGLKLSSLVCCPSRQEGQADLQDENRLPCGTTSKDRRGQRAMELRVWCFHGIPGLITSAFSVRGCSERDV